LAITNTICFISIALIFGSTRHNFFYFLFMCVDFFPPFLFEVHFQTSLSQLLKGSLHYAFLSILNPIHSPPGIDV